MTVHSSPADDLKSLLDLYEDFLRTGFRGAPRTRPSVTQVMGAVADQVAACRRCRLSENRRIPVPGAGSLAPLVLVVGEGPGEAEDACGRPFVGPAGRYLDRWLGAVRIGSESVPLGRETNTYITNVVKCRPPGNRDPEPDETEACFPYLQRQIAALRPRAILTLGRIACQVLTGASRGIGASRGRVHAYEGIPLVPTYHPSAVLRNPALRAPVWEDLKLLRSVLEDG